MTAPAAPATAEARLKARVAAMTDKGLAFFYQAIAAMLEAKPRGKDAGAHIDLLSAMNAETTRRDIPCCLQCSVPLSANWHAASLHTAGTPADLLADAIAGALVAAHTAGATGYDPTADHHLADAGCTCAVSNNPPCAFCEHVGVTA